MGTAITTVEVLMSDLEHGGGKKAVPLVSFVKWCAWIANGHTNGSFEAMFTHFALRLTDGNGEQWVAERCEAGVRYAPTEATDAGVSALRWTTDLDRDVVDAFVQEQRGLDYDLFSKNCKHFAYDLLTRAGLVESKFECFCQRAELAYRSY